MLDFLIVLTLGFLIITSYIFLIVAFLYSLATITYVLFLSLGILPKLTQSGSSLYRSIEPALGLVCRIFPTAGRYTMAPLIVIVAIILSQIIYHLFGKFIVSLIMPPF